MDALSSSFLSSTRHHLHINRHPPLHPHPPLQISAVSTGEKPPQIALPTKTKKSQTVAEPKQRQSSQTRDIKIGSTIRIPAPARPRSLPLPPPSPAVAFCNVMDDIINTFIDPPVLRSSVDPRHVLSTNFSPVPELSPTFCPLIRGTIPQSLVGGAYIRNGPNPQHLPRGPHHLFDGDGMLHSILLSPSGATLSSRFVRTSKYSQEHAAGAPVFPNVFSGFHGVGGIARGAVSAVRILTGQMNPLQGVGLANTSLMCFANRLYALGESDLPYSIHVDQTTGDISTMGRCDFDGKLVMGMTAHPKVDPVTEEMFAFRYGPVPPYVTYFRFDREGNKGADVPIFSVTRPSFLHDFAVTENYAIFNDIQIVMQPMEMVFGGGSPVGSDHGKVPRVGLLPRYAVSESEMRWFDVPGFNIMHSLNAWEEEGGDVIVLIAPNVLSIEHALEHTNLVHSSVEMLKINLKTNIVSRTPLSSYNLDFGVINPNYVAKKNRFAYLGIGDPMPKIGGIAKLDFDRAGSGDCIVGRRIFGERCFGGEPFFVPNDDASAEDDGHVVSYVHDEKRDESRFVVMDAKSPELEIVAEVLLPRRVPYGFHGLFVSRKQLESQQGYRHIVNEQV